MVAGVGVGGVVVVVGDEGVEGVADADAGRPSEKNHPH